MQVTYRTISSYEYDVASGVYKKVDKEIEDTSGSSQNFMDMFSNFGEEVQDSTSKANENNFQNLSSQNQGSFYAGMSHVYAYRFRQNENEASLKTQNATIQNEQFAQEQNKKGGILNDLLNSL